MNTTHESTCSRIRTEIVSRSESSSCIIHIVTMIAGKCVEILCRYVETYIGYIFVEPLIREVVAQFYIGYFPVGCILNLA